MENNDKKQINLKAEYMRIFARISAWIIGPVLVSLFVGKYLDKKFGTAPWILGVGLALSFTVSMVAIVKIAKKYDTKILKENPPAQAGDGKDKSTNGK
jgi:F0F1-type ATP synthase assembly protein I